MTSRPLRGNCHCGRNAYIVTAPEGTTEVAQVLFDNSPFQRVSMASPLAAFLRVPLSWYHATTISYFPDETSAQIHRAYSHPLESTSKRHFCGFCGTPLSFWSEDPRDEAEYIHLTLGSLCAEDLNDIEELGLLPSSDDEAEPQAIKAARQEGQETAAALDTAVGKEETAVAAGRETTSPSWLDSLTQGSRLGKLRTMRGSSESKDGRVKLRWEVVEWTDGGEENSPVPAKRKLGDREEGDQEMQGAQ